MSVTSIGKDVGKLEHSYTAGGKSTLENHLAVSQINVQLTYGPAILLDTMYTQQK